MIGIDRYISDLKSAGWKVDGPIQSGGQIWAIVRDFKVPHGRFSGADVQIAVPAPGDFPATPPGGFYVSPAIVPRDDMGRLSIHDRANETAGLSGPWQYWSRPIPPGTWRSERAVKRLIAHWNAALANAN